MGLILSPSEVRAECAYLRTALNSNIEAYRNAQEKVREFVDDGRLNSQAWEEMKDNVNVCYQLVVEGVLLAYDDIMSDMDNLEGVIGDEYLNENELCEKIRSLEKECKRYENILQQRLIYWERYQI